MTLCGLALLRPAIGRRLSCLLHSKAPCLRGALPLRNAKGGQMGRKQGAGGPTDAALTCYPGLPARLGTEIASPDGFLIVGQAHGDWGAHGGNSLLCLVESQRGYGPARSG
jgi:hypothetical protein